MNSIKLPFYARLAFILVIIIAAGYLAIIGEEMVVPLLFSFLFAVLLLPLANFFENKARLPRSVSGILAVVLLLAVISLIIYILAAQLTQLGSEWPALKQQLTGLMTNIKRWVYNTFAIRPSRQTAYIQNASNNFFKSSGSLIEKTLLSLSGIFLFLIFILIYTILLLFYRRLLMRFVVAAFTDKYVSIIYDILTNVKKIIRSYITGLFLEMAIVAAISCLVFWLLGVDYVFLLGLLVAILNIIPYIGIFTALVLGAAITFATSDGYHTLLVAITIVCIHLLDSNFLMPKIVGSKVQLNPLIVILGVIIGEMLFGISGMFLSIPYLAVAKVIFDRVENLQAWGILLGDEEETPRKVERLEDKIKEKQKTDHKPDSIKESDN